MVHSARRYGDFRGMCELNEIDDWETVPWTEWPTNRRKATQEPRTDLPPIHEPEPGLLDEEILPLRDDWMKGPKG